jgi:hypothetical protein
VISASREGQQRPSVRMTEGRCSLELPVMREFTAACPEMKPLVEFTTKALGLKF